MGIKSQKGATLLELIMLITIVSVGVFSFGGILANMVDMTTRATLIRRASFYGEAIVNRIVAYTESGDALKFQSFLDQIVSEMDGKTTADNYTIHVSYTPRDDFWEDKIHPAPFLYKRGFLVTITVSHDLLPQPFTFSYYYPAIQNDYTIESSN
jgi:type II secretory pathway pseudopilin PulG